MADLFYQDFCVILPMAFHLTIFGAFFEFKDSDLIETPMSDYLGGDGSSVDIRFSDNWRIAIGNQQYLVEADLFSDFSVDQGYFGWRVRLNGNLCFTSFYYSLHQFLRISALLSFAKYSRYNNIRPFVKTIVAHITHLTLKPRICSFSIEKYVLSGGRKGDPHHEIPVDKFRGAGGGSDPIHNAIIDIEQLSCLDRRTQGDA